MSTLETALAIACRAHSGQKDMAGEPYILHVLRVVLGCSEERKRIVAALHDVLEDCPDVTFTDLLDAGFSAETIAAVDALTHRPTETYTGYILRLSSNPTAVSVKLADLRDNLDRTRIASPTDRDLARWKKYEDARALLLSIDRPRAGLGGDKE